MFKIGEKVKGERKQYDPLTEEYPEENNAIYNRTISHDFEDGSFLVRTNDNEELLIELYNDETMELVC